MKFLTRAQVRAVDRIAIEDLGIPGKRLMENAGKGAAEVCRTFLRRRGARVVIVAGTGNNGGDGFVVARHLASRGARVQVLLLGEPRTADAASMLVHIRRRPRVRIESAAPGAAWERAAAAFDGADLVVDAVFGTGLDREVGGELRAVLERIGRTAAPRVALDLPSGLDANTGRPLGVAVRATATATFVAPKRGMVVHPGLGYVGEVTVVPIGTPPDLLDRTGWDGEVIERPFVRAVLPPRPADGHKGTFGHVLVVAGSPGKTGAALLSAYGALRAGAGLATIAARGAAAAALDAKGIEVMTEPLPWAASEAAPRVLDLAAPRDALVLGPGLGLDADAAALCDAVVRSVARPLVVDADAVTHLAASPAALRARPAPTVLTPHPGELARLLGVTTAEVQADRIGVARTTAADLGAVVVLKGARTVIASPDGALAVCPTGNSLLATGGTGDVLTGVVAALLAQGVEAFEAARAAVYLHGLAADLLAEDGTDRGVLASEVAANVRQAIRAVRAG